MSRIWCTVPDSYGKPNYNRRDPKANVYKVVKGSDAYTFRFVTDVAITNPVVEIHMEGKKLTELPAVQSKNAKGTPIAGTYEARFAGMYDWPEGELLAYLRTDALILQQYGKMTLTKTGKPIKGKQWMVVGARNFHGELMSGRQGWEWVYLDPEIDVPFGAKITPRQAVPFSGRVSRTKLWQQTMTATVSMVGHREVTYGTDGKCGPGEGYASIAGQEAYHQDDNFVYWRSCQARDGYYGVGRAGSAWNAHVVRSTGALRGISGYGRLFEISLDGYVHTHAGPRLKDPARPAPYLGNDNAAASVAWAKTFYELVGEIEGGPIQLAWQTACDPRDDTIEYIPDVNRVIRYDTKTGKGVIIAGGMNNQGYQDGVGAEVKFNQLRGIVWDLSGDFFYLADDHNSAIRACDRNGKVWTVRKCKGWFDGVIYRNMNELVQHVPLWANLPATLASMDGVNPDLAKYFTAQPDGTFTRIGNPNFRCLGLSPYCIVWPNGVVRRAESFGVQWTFTAAKNSGYTDFLWNIRSVMKDGGADAVWMHPQALGIFKDGKLCVPCHHPHVVLEIDPSSPDAPIRTLTNLVATVQTGHLEHAWISVSVDTFGEFGPAGDFCLGYFTGNTHTRHQRDGKSIGFYTGPDGVSQSESGCFLSMGSGPVNFCTNTGYPHAVAFGPGCLWFIPTAGDGAARQTLMLPSDMLDANLYRRGQSLVNSYGIGTRVSAPYVRRGLRGISRIGEVSAIDFINNPDGLRGWVSTWDQAKMMPWTEADVNAVVYHLTRANEHVTQSLRGIRPVNRGLGGGDPGNGGPPPGDPNDPNTQKLKDLQDKLDIALVNLANAQRSEESAKAAYDGAQVAITESEQILSDIAKQVDEGMTAVTNAQKALNEASAKLAELQAAVVSQTAVVDQAKAAADSLNQSLQTAKEAWAAQASAIEEARRGLAQIQSSLDAASSAADTAQAAVDAIQDQIDALEDSDP